MAGIQSLNAFRLDAVRAWGVIQKLKDGAQS
jgi:hypothetical protein